MYNALVTKIKTQPHPNADRLQIGMCHGFQVVVGLDTQDDQLGVFFPCDGQLSDEFCKQNHLYPEYNSLGERVGGGFIDPKNRRVRAQNFRKVKSEGFWVPLSYFEYTGYDLKEGDMFTKLGKHEVCNKFINPATLRALKNAKGGSTKVNVKETPMFPMHLDTKQLRYYIDSLPKDSTIYITEKLHGTSGRTGYSPKPKLKPTLVQKFKENILSFFGIEEAPKYEILTGSRRVIKTVVPGQSGYYNSDSFRYEISERLKPFLRKGESIYYEIVGYVGDSPIMPEVDNSTVGKDFVKKFGKKTAWTYGNVPGQYEIYVYNWMISTEDGHHYSYPWDYIVKRCEECGLNTAPLLDRRKLVQDSSFGPEYLIDKEDLAARVDELTQDQFSTLHPHLAEGVCLRVEKDGQMVNIYKNKARSFGILEGYLKQDEAYVDTEEVESYQ